MSMIFSNYDRTQNCDHAGCLGPKLEDASRICIRCGRTVHDTEDEKFTKPAASKGGRRNLSRLGSSSNENRPAGGK